jgi:phosphate transport system permease protein
VDGVSATAAAAESGDYALSRPLFIYTTADILQRNQAASVFVNYYLTHVNKEIEDVGYFPASSERIMSAQQAWVEANPGLGLQPGQWANINPNGLGGTVRIAGSSTVFPLTQRLGEQFQSDGFGGTISEESVGSTAGFQRLCVAGDVDIANASRPITSAEYSACRANNRRPIEIRVGTDALAVIVSSENSFLTGVTQEELKQIFTTAVNWSDVNPAWPHEPIHRYIPGADSGTLDFFAETILNETLAEAPVETLVQVLAQNISVGLGRRLERDQRFFENALVFDNPTDYNAACASDTPAPACTLPPRSQQNVYDLIVTEVLKPDVLQSWSFADSVFNRSAIEAEQQLQYPNAELVFRSWLSPKFLVSPQSSQPVVAGVRTAIFGSLWVIAITILFSFPVGVGAAVYLEEYAIDLSGRNRITERLNRLIETNIRNLAGVPSIIYGLLGLTVFVRIMEPLTSGAMFGAVEESTTANGRTILAAGLTLALLILPLIIIQAQEAIRAVPRSLRQASMALGATKLQTIWHHVIPSALPGILTGTILAISRAIGETAPLVVIGASTFITIDPSGPFSKFTTLPIQIYQWTSRPQAEFRNIAAAAIVVLLVMLLTLNASAVFLRNRYSRRA